MKYKLFLLVLAALLMLSISCIIPSEAKDKDKNKKDTYTVAVIDTGKGVMKAVLFTDKVPITTDNFIKLANEGFYKDLVFHRVEPDFVIQTGDPTGTGAGGSGKMIPLEIHRKLKHKKGALGMARKANPDSATSQFYVTLKRTSKLDGHYAVFGQLYEGFDVMNQIIVGDSLDSVEIIEVPKSEVKL